ncbi:hypothetical protein BJ085DRAFT_31827 [Dimargaris cristalligena]|uniref:Uncharacterized protein n=1 Tax=Dimargaris cristalligena TaxID=215637 RepID=A0A4P9ZX78_9FUNG|nr:hypothetical protein BJ085DRAFT_31827 [Dimargaris cristalligena]|eukprot:RKP37310.1 hypothetical protein BJ085DRAFT_31827 [Dimargaris cristalligena]
MRGLTLALLAGTVMGSTPYTKNTGDSNPALPKNRATGQSPTYSPFLPTFEVGDFYHFSEAKDSDSTSPLFKHLPTEQQFLDRPSSATSWTPYYFAGTAWSHFLSYMRSLPSRTPLVIYFRKQIKEWANNNQIIYKITIETESSTPVVALYHVPKHDQTYDKESKVRTLPETDNIDDNSWVIYFGSFPGTEAGARQWKALEDMVSRCHSTGKQLKQLK